MFHIATGLVAVYVIWNVIWRSPRHALINYGLAVAAILASQHHLITRLFFGSMASPEVPAPVLMFAGWGFGALLISAVLALMLDLAGAGLRLAGKWRHRPMMVPSARLYACSGLLALALSGVAVWQAVKVPEVRTIEIAMADLPSSFDGYRIVQVTDLHASRLLQRPWMTAVVAKANALDPDLMLLTGDMVDGTVASRGKDVEPLRSLQARHGVFAVPGNHDYYGGYEEWLAHFRTLGLRMLLNEHVNIHNGQDALVLAGVTDKVAERSGQPMPDIRAALTGVPKNAPVILMSHRPAGAAVNAAAGVELQLSGHTHGGHLAGFHWAVQLANEGYVSGHYQVGAMALYVSNGAGLWAGFPLRLGARSEITEIILRASR